MNFLFAGAWVWKANTFPKVRCFFLWKCLHRSIPIREVLSARGINIPSLCPLCNDAIESIFHTLRDCPQARSFWESLLLPKYRSWFYNMNIEDWLRTNCASNLAYTSGISWGIIFLFGVWSLWLRRNKVVFGNNPSHKPLMTETIAKAAEFAFLGAHTKVRCSLTTIQVQGYAPLDNWFKLNSNGSSMGNLGRAGKGGLTRNSKGEWVSGYARAIGYTTSVMAELWALRDGINLCIDLNLKNVIIELDAKLVVDLLMKDERRSNGNEVIIANYKECLKRIPRVKIQHCFREANKCADALARRGAVSPNDFVVFQFPPADVALLASLDAAGTLYERFCSSVSVG